MLFLLVIDYERIISPDKKCNQSLHKAERVPSLDPVQHFEFPASDILQADFHFLVPEDRTSQNVLD